MDLRAFISSLYDRGDDPFGLTGKRDDTLQMVLALANQYQTEDPEILMGNAPRPEPQPEPRQSSRDEIWRRFQEMNPNLDYDKVAQQSGGTVPGGTFSEPQNNFAPDHPQSDEAFISWVQNELPIYDAQRKLDPRSREYDPEGAKIIFDSISQRKNDAKEAIYAKARQMEAEQAQRLFDYGTSIGGRIDTMIEGIKGNKMLEMEAPGVMRALLLAKNMQMSGREAEAEQLLNEAMSMLSPAVETRPEGDKRNKLPEPRLWTFSRQTGIVPPGS